MLDLIFRNGHYKIAALLAAVVTWLYVQSDELHIEPVKAQIAWDLAEGVVAVDALPAHMTLRVEGTRAAIRRARRADISVVADLSNLGPGQHALEFAPLPVAGLPSGLEVRSHVPSGARFELDRVGNRRVEVRPQIVGQPEPGYAVENVQVQPAVVVIRGARSKIDSLSTVRTEPIDVSGLESGDTRPVRLDLPQGVEPAEVYELEAAISVLALNEQRTFTEVPVHVWGSDAWSVTVPLAQITLKGPAATLRQIAPEDVTVFVHPPQSGTRARYQAQWNVPGPVKLRVLHAAGSTVEPVEVVPATMELVPR